MASTLNSSFELSRRLVAAGHEIVYLSHLDLKSRIEGQGHQFIQLTACEQLRQSNHDFLKSSGPLRSPRKILKAFEFGRRARLESMQNSEIEDHVATIQPQLLIIDIEMHYAVLSCLNLGIPILTPIVWFSIFRDRDLPPLHTLLQPPRTTAQRIRNRLVWWKMLALRRMSHFSGSLNSNKLKRLVRPVSYETNHRGDLKAVASIKGVDFNRHTDWTHWIRPHFYPNLKVMCFNAWGMEFPHNPPKQIEYVGPMVHAQRIETQVTNKAHSKWVAYRDKCKLEKMPIVYCSLGTYWSADTPFLQKIISIFKRRSDLALVIGLGGKLKPSSLAPCPDNVLAMEFAPQLDVLSNSAAAISHGGITTINECISFEVPLLVCSTGHVDQDGCSARVNFHQLGISADIESATSAELEISLDRLLGDETIRANVKRMKEQFQKYREDRSAETLIDTMLRQSEPS